MQHDTPWPFIPSMSPPRAKSTEGAYIVMENGDRILDAAGGAIVANIGHGRRDVADVIGNAAANASYVVPPWLTPEREALIHELHEHWLPDHLPCIHLTSGGSEANEAAIKMAVQYHAAKGQPQKHIVLARSLSYHGTTISMAGTSGHAARKRGLESIITEVPRIETPYPLRCPIGSFHPDAADYYLSNLEETIEQIGADNIAALIAEPINGSSGGMITPPDGYWERAAAILKEHNILLIMDEVMTGFGRTGKRFGCELYNIEPDLLVAGKGMAGGYAAIAGVYGRVEVAQAIADGGYNVMFHTFGALPQSCAAAAKVLSILREEDMLAKAEAAGNELMDRLQLKFSQHPLVAEIRGQGLMIGIEVVRDRETLTPFDEVEGVTEKMVTAAMNEGVFFYPGGTGEVRDILCIGAPFIINGEDMDKMVNALDAALGKVLPLA